MIKGWITAVLGVVLSAGIAGATETLNLKAEGAVDIGKAMELVVKSQQAFDAAVVDNKMDELKKHAQATVDAAGKVKEQIDSLPESAKAAAEVAANLVMTSGKELVKIAQDNTIAENGQVAAKLRQQVKALKEAVASAGTAGDAVTSGTASAETPLGNTNCPVSGHAVGSMQPGSHVVYKGQSIGLCCDGCKEQFLANADAYLAKLKAEKK